MAEVHPDTSVLELALTTEDTDIFNDLTIVGKLISHKPINFKAIQAVLSSAWNLGQNVHIKPLDQNLISCTFKHPSDRNRIVDTGPWSVKGCLLNLKPWPSHLNIEELDFSTTPFWLQVHNLPRNRMNPENAQKLGNHAGRFLSMDPNAQIHTVQKFLRLRVEIDTTKSLKRGCYITREDGSKLWISFRYERLSDFCYGCGHLGHTQSACPSDNPAPSALQQDKLVYGDWLRARSRTSARSSPGQQKDHTQPVTAPHPTVSLSSFLLPGTPSGPPSLSSDTSADASTTSRAPLPALQNFPSTIPSSTNHPAPHIQNFETTSQPKLLPAPSSPSSPSPTLTPTLIQPNHDCPLLLTSPSSPTAYTPDPPPQHSSPQSLGPALPKSDSLCPPHPNLSAPHSYHKRPIPIDSPDFFDFSHKKTRLNYTATIHTALAQLHLRPHPPLPPSTCTPPTHTVAELTTTQVTITRGRLIHVKQQARLRRSLINPADHTDGLQSTTTLSTAEEAGQNQPHLFQ